jgi:hypothetical protein
MDQNIRLEKMVLSEFRFTIFLVILPLSDLTSFSKYLAYFYSDKKS